MCPSSSEGIVFLYVFVFVFVFVYMHLYLFSDQACDLRAQAHQREVVGFSCVRLWHMVE